MSAQPAQFRLPFSHYAALGYHPIPTDGKVPVGGAGWNQRVYTQQEYIGLDATQYNVGLLCSNVVGIDIDVQDASHAKAVERVVRKVLRLPKDAPRRVGRDPKALFICRVSSPLKGFDIAHDADGKRSVLFQLLGQGKQFVIDGTHPDTHKPYTLNAPLPKHAELPEVSPEQADALRTAITETLAGLGYNVHATGSTGKQGTGKFSGPPWTPTGLAQAVEELAKLNPDMSMNEWAMVGMALHDGTHGSQEGLDAWDAWSQQGEKYKSRRDLEGRWRGFKVGGAVTRATLFRNDFPKLDAPGSPDEPAVEVEDSDDDDGLLGDDARSLFRHDAGEVPWIVEDTMTYGAHLLVGRPKGGKSWITLDMAYACASGGEFLGRQAGEVGVLWIASEDTRDGLSRRIKVRREMPPEGIVVMTMERLKKERDRSKTPTFEAWLKAFLEASPGSFGLVIIDTHKTVEAIWQNEKIDQRRNASIVDIAYQSVRIYDDIGQTNNACIVLVHHAGKMQTKRNGVVDYHELINLPATAVAGATASMVLADPPDRDIHDEDDHRRVFALRGRHVIKEAPLLIELKDGRAQSLGTYREIVQSEAQAETMETIEALLREQGWPQGEAWVTYKDIAAELGKHEKTIGGHFKAMKKDSQKMFWKEWRIVLQKGKGVTLRAK